MALGGGGAKGLAHVGVIKALLTMGVPIDFVAGTSMGALVGAVYAALGDVQVLEDAFLSLKRADIFPLKSVLKHKDGALFRDESMVNALEERLHGVSFAQCKIPFRAVATDVSNGDRVVIGEGDLVGGVRASIALPIVFNPVSWQGKLLMDGGFSDPVPADVVRAMGADVVIAVDVSSRWINMTSDDALDVHNVYSVISNSLEVTEYQIAKKVLASDADIVLRPTVLGYSWMDFNHAQDMIFAGEREVRYQAKTIVAKTGIAQPPKTVLEKLIDFMFS